MIPVFLAVSVLTFVITNAAGDPIQLIRIFFKRLPPDLLASLRSFYHLDQPLFARYFYWLQQFLTGNLGISPTDARPVADKILPWVWPTLELQLSALALALAIGIPIGIFSAKHQYQRSDVAVTTTAIFGVSMPTFWLGIILILIFSVYLHALPGTGALDAYNYGAWWDSSYALNVLAHLILPVAVLTFVSIAVITRLVRANMLEVLRQDYILAARASGLKERRITYRYALKNAITPVVTIVGLTFGLSLAGAPGLETTFSWPGLGYAFVNAALVLDLPTVQAITMIITILVLLANLGTDLAYAWLDPRVRLS